jgi:uncharacterized protein YodC (DUF2158 family)
VLCRWFDNGKLAENTFDESSLEAYDRSAVGKALMGDDD